MIFLKIIGWAVSIAAAALGIFLLYLGIWEANAAEGILALQNVDFGQIVVIVAGLTCLAFGAIINPFVISRIGFLDKPWKIALSCCLVPLILLAVSPIEVKYGNKLWLAISADPPPATDVRAFKDCEHCPEMLPIPAGTFMMGAAAGEVDLDFSHKPTPVKEDEFPQHRVDIKPFAAGRFEVTFDDWGYCVSSGGCRSNKRPDDHESGRGRKPVSKVSWQDAQEYVQWLSAKTGKKYRLLSEAEWEYAARAGTTTAYFWGDSVGKKNSYCACGRNDRRKVRQVGAFKPNAFGLYDTSGNVSEWVQDLDHDTYSGAPADGSAWMDETNQQRSQPVHIVRGGYFWSMPGSERSAHRDFTVDGRFGWAGFRLARDLPAMEVSSTAASAPGMQATPALPADAATAAETCYFSQMESSLHSGSKTVTARDELGPLTYFMIAAVKARTGGAPALRLYNQFLKDDAMAGKYMSVPNLPAYLDQCFARFPLAKADSGATLPTDKTARDAICLYISGYVPLINGNNVGDDPIIAKAQSVNAAILRDEANLDAIDLKYGVHGTQDSNHLQEKIVADTTDIGNLYSIINQCSLELASAPVPAAPQAPIAPAAAPVVACGEPFPCQLERIIDRSDWNSVRSAIVAAYKIDIKTRVNWSSKKHGHKGYVLRAPKGEAGGACKTYEIVSFMGGETGREKVQVCARPDGAVEISGDAGTMPQPALAAAAPAVAVAAPPSAAPLAFSAPSAKMEQQNAAAISSTHAGASPCDALTGYAQRRCRWTDRSPAALAAAAAKREEQTGDGMLLRKEYAAAIPHYIAACDAGIAASCYNLGQIYDDADGVPPDKARAAILFDKGCTGGIASSCLQAGNVSAGDKERQIKYYRMGCQGVGGQSGKIGSCERWATVQPGADTAWIASMLSTDPDSGTTLKEQSLVISDPRAMGQLCSSRNMRACFAIEQTLENLHLADVVGNPDHHFTAESLRPIQAAMKDRCKAPVIGADTKERDAYCVVSDMVNYAILHNFGPAADDPTSCVQIAGTGTTTDYYWVDLQTGEKTFKDSSYSPSGTDIQNDCNYAVDIANFSGDAVTLQPHQLFRASLELNELLTNGNSPKVRYIKRHE